MEVQIEGDAKFKEEIIDLVKCRQCSRHVDGTTNRLIHDSCGHMKCRKCLLEEEDGCLECIQSKPVSESHEKNNMVTFTTEELKKLLASKGNKKRKNILHLLSHITVLQGEPPMYQCNVCEKKFKTKAHIKYHEFCPSGNKPLKCKDCGQGFVSKSHYEYHRRTHTGERPFNCQVCSKGFSQKGKLTRHLRSHTGEKPYACKDCDRRFANTEGLKSHNVLHTGERKYGCDQCEKKFISQTNLNKHTLSHTGEKPHQCEECGKMFASKWNMELHRRIHIPVRQFRCFTCHRCFVEKKDLKRHNLIHSDEKLHECPLCHTSFRRKDNLERHLKNSHAEQTAKKSTSVSQTSNTASTICAAETKNPISKPFNPQVRSSSVSVISHVSKATPNGVPRIVSLTSDVLKERVPTPTAVILPTNNSQRSVISREYTELSNASKSIHSYGEIIEPASTMAVTYCHINEISNEVITPDDVIISNEVVLDISSNKHPVFWTSYRDDDD